MRPRLPFPQTAALYTVAYVVAVLADHLSTVEAARNGGIETNVLFQTASKGLAETRAEIAFIVLWPIMLGLLWLADRRSRRTTRKRRTFTDEFLGRTPEAPAMIPAVVVTGKLLVFVPNLLVAWYHYSIYRPFENALAAAGVASASTRVALGGAIIVVPALVMGYVLARWWYDGAK